MGRGDFIESGGNAPVAAQVCDPAQWPDGRLALVGPAASGKTHLVHALMAETGAARIEARALMPEMVTDLVATPCVAVEDADRLARSTEAEAALFHLLNLSRAEGTPLLVTGRAMPGRWAIALPDLASRLSAMVPVTLASPDDALLEALVAKLMDDRHLTYEAGLPAFLAARIERSFAAAQAIVATLDEQSLAERRNITRKFAGTVLGATPRRVDDAS